MSRTLVRPSQCPTGWVDVGETFIYSLTAGQRTAFLVDWLRYFTWDSNNRAIDPWDSGAGQGQRYDRPRIVRGPPVGGYGPGTCSEPETDQSLARMAAQYQRLTDQERALLRWRLVGDNWHGTSNDRKPLTLEEVAARFGIGVDAVGDRWRILRVRLWYRLV